MAAQSPLKSQWDRVLQVGDASGIQSPLSFGGFGALTRHLGRLRSAITEALEADALDKDSLAQVRHEDNCMVLANKRLIRLMWCLTCCP